MATLPTPTISGQVYLVELVDRVKVGRTRRGIKRVLDHLGCPGRYWISAPTAHATAIETTLIRACVSRFGPPVAGREYFAAEYDEVLPLIMSIAAEKRFNW